MGYRDDGGIRKDKLKNRDKDQVYRAHVKKRLDKVKPDAEHRASLFEFYSQDLRHLNHVGLITKRLSFQTATIRIEGNFESAKFIARASLMING